MAATRVNVFHPRLVLERVKSFAFPPDLAERHARIEVWREHLRRGSLDAQGEVKLHGDFLQRVFGDILGYRPFAHATSDGWEINSEQKVVGPGSSDGALGFFHTKHPPKVIAPIELKGSKQSLDHAVGNPLTPVQQGWDYANKSPGSRWIIVSNYKETRLYSKDRTPSHYEVFELDTLHDLDAFKRFYFLLARANLLPAVPDGRSPLDELLAASAQMEVEVTRKLYGQYRTLRGGLFKHLAERHSNLPALDRLRFTQTILDRALFVAFAEDRGLLPPKTLETAISFRNPYNPVPVWTNLKSVFAWVDKGNPDPKFNAYNGGLFAHDADIDSLELSDAICRSLGELGAYDFRDDVSVDVLGHIFEQSITDLEDLRAEASGEAVPKVSKRKTEGVFYTPAYITRYIVDQTLGKHLDEKLAAAIALHKPEEATTKKDREARWIAVWENHRDVLTTVRVLDPACGSGAFLLAAYDLLERAYERVKGELLALRPGQLEASYSVTTILNNNLFGVDVNAESVEITRLSLWLRTASAGSRLTYLDRNIKRGNSVVSDPKLDDYAFNWKLGTEAIRALGEPQGEEDERIDARWREGFDVVIGNPPYVRQELLAPYKEHLAKHFASYHGKADLYVYFYELGLRVLREGGRLGFVSSGTFARTNMASAFRNVLPKLGCFETLVDFGENQPFEDAEMVRPSIVVLRKGAAPTDFRYLLLDEKIPESLSETMEAEGVECSVEVLDEAEWSFCSKAVHTLTRKLLTHGTQLGELPGVRILYGIKTGLNEAFVISNAKRDELVRADPRSAEVIMPMLSGAELRPWYQQAQTDWMIFTRRGIKITEYPAVLVHLEGFREALEPKPANWPQKKAWAGRAPGTYPWFEIQGSIDYHQELALSKICWPDISKLPRFSLDATGAYMNNTGSMMPTDDPSLLAILQSRVTWLAISQICTQLRLRAGLWQYRLLEQFMHRLPIPAMTEAQRAELSGLAIATTEHARKRYALHQTHRHRMQTDLVPKERTLNDKLTAWWSVSFGDVRAELQRTYKTDVPLRERDDWESLWKERRAEHDALTAKIVACEEEINDRVFGLFELSAEERRIVMEETKFRYGEV